MKIKLKRMMRKSNKKEKINKGSILVGVILMFMLISSIAIALINRAFHGAVITTDTRKGYSAYQASDQVAEAFLDNLKKLDNNTDGNIIPENMDFTGSDFCPIGGDVVCSDQSDNSLVSTEKVSDIFRIKSKGDAQGLKRYIQLDVSDRVDSGLENNSLEVEKCGDGNGVCTFNRCDVKISLTPNGAEDIRKKIKDYEIRRSTSALLSDDPSGSYGWRLVGSNSDKHPFGGLIVSKTSFILKNGDEYLKNLGEVQYGKDYYFTVKARNRNPFNLDSLYLAKNATGESDKKISLENSADCTDDSVDQLYGKGCILRGTNPPGTKLSTKSYNCCNNTECYEPDTHWLADGSHDCALQKCEYEGDEVSVYPNGDASIGSGWCGASPALCRKGQDCSFPYRTVGYCKSEPAPNTQTSFFNASGWQYSNYSVVYKADSLVAWPAPNSPTPSAQPRCTQHLCPSDVTNIAKCGDLPAHGASWSNTSTCSENICGPYSFDINCNLNCDQRYYESNPASDYPWGTCCTETCSDVSYVNWGDCTDHRCQENICGTRSVTDTAWAKSCSNPSCQCGVAVSCTPDCVGSTNGSCNPVNTCQGTRACVTGKDEDGNDIMGTCDYTYDCC